MSKLVCPGCQRASPIDAPLHTCACGELLEVEHGPVGVERATFDLRRGARQSELPGGVWRFRECVDPELPTSAVVSLSEGATPLLRSRALAAWTGLEALAFKHEGRNPSGSFKDRGMTVAVSRARHAGARSLVCASTGNTAASLAAYAGSAGLPCAIVAPEAGTAPAKLAQALAHGARCVLVRGDFDRAMALVLELAREEGLALQNSANPFRLEGQKTLVLELLQDLGWEPPDWIVFPAGNLGNCAAFGKALREARAAGWIARMPRLAAVQAAGAAPFAHAFRRGFERLEPVEARTLASAIRIGAPVSYRRAVRSIRETGGVVLEVSDAAILEAKARVDRSGIGAEPASAASLAGARELASRGVIGKDERVVCVLTAHMLKDPLGGGGQQAEAPLVVDASKLALSRALAGSG